MMNDYNSLSWRFDTSLKTREPVAAESPHQGYRRKQFTWLMSLMLIVGFMLTGSNDLFGQTTLINPATDGGFENGPNLSDNGWTSVTSGQSFFLGSPTPASAGARCAYTSTTAGSWTPGAVASVAHIYKDITIPAGHTAFELSLKYKVSVVDAGFDFIKVFLVPTTTVPVGGTELTAGQLGYRYDGTTSYANYVFNGPVVPGNSYRVVISFRADGVSPHAAAAIDEVSGISSANLPTGSATAIGGLWSSPATWVGGIVPSGGANVTIPAGSTVTIDQTVAVSDLTVSGTLQWNGTAGSSNTLNVNGNLTINSGGSLLAYASASTGATVNISGNFVNNGYANFSVGTSTSSLLNFNGSGSSLSGTGTFEGDGTRGIVRQLFFQNTGANSVSTTQGLTAHTLAHTAGSLNTGGKIRVDNTAQSFGQAIQTKVANVAVTNMGSGYTAAPIPSCSGAALWTSGASLAIGNVRTTATDIYLCTTAGTAGTSAPTHTSGTATATGGTAVFLWLAPAGTIGTPYISTALTVNTQYFYGGNLYTAVATTAMGTTPPTHTSGVVGSFRYVGTPARISVNWDSSTSTVRSVNLIEAGSGYASSTGPSIVFVPNAAGSGASATAHVLYTQNGPTASSFLKTSGTATITGGLTINSDQGASVASSDVQASSGVGSVFCTACGNNYTSAPTIGFAGPTTVNLVTNPGSGYASAPTISVTGGTLISGTALTSSNFTINVHQGKLVSVYLNTSTSATYSTPPTLSVTGGATLEFPAGSWPTATASVGANGQILGITMTNPGFGYSAAPTVGVTGGSPTTAASFTSRVALYGLTLNYYSPAAAPGVNPDDASIPTNRKMNSLTLAGNGNGIALTGDLTLFGTSPLSLTASGIAPGNVINLGGNNLNFTHHGYTGATSTFGATNTYIKNGSMTLTNKGGSNTLNFPFSGTFSYATGSGSVATGSTALTVKVTEGAAPTNATTGTGLAKGTRSFRVQTASTLASAAIPGTNPTVTLNYNSEDALPGVQNDTYVGDATALSGPWTIRSTAMGASATALAATGSKTTATAAPGPIAPTGNDYYAWVAGTPTITNVSPLTLCANSGSFTITGTNLSAVTAVSIGGTPVTSFTVVSATSITGVAGSGTTGVVTVISNGSPFSGSQTVNVDPSPSAPSVSPNTATVLMGAPASFTASGGAGTFNWYDAATGGNLLFTGATYSLAEVCSTRTVYVSENNGSCDGARTAVPITVQTAVITPSVAYFCGTGGNSTLNVSPVDPLATYTWTVLTPGTGSLSSTSVASPTATVTGTADFSLTVTRGGCSYTTAYSVGVYALPTANLTSTGNNICPGTGTVTINSGLSAGNFSATCITAPGALSTPPPSAVTLCSGGSASVSLTSGSLDDGYWNAIPVGFNFNYFGTPYNTINLGTNGTGVFGANGSTQYNFTGGFPNAANPANTIAMCARDLQLSASGGNAAFGTGTVRYWTEGVAPNRRFVVQYAGCTTWYSTNATDGYNSVETVFYETTGIIDIRVINSTNPTATSGTFINDTRNKFIGLQDGTRTIGATAPNCSTSAPNYWNGQSAVITTPQAWRFAPPSNYTTVWTKTDSGGTSTIASGTNIFSQTVSPNETTTYSISYTNQTTGCSNAPGSAQVTVNMLGTIAPTGVNAVASSTSVCSGSTVGLSTDYTGSTSGLTYQWQVNTGSGFTDIPSATAATYTTPALTVTGNQYRVGIRSCGGTVSYSSAVTISVNNPSLASTTGQTKCGNTASFTLSATPTNGAHTVEWYAASTGGSVLATGTTFNTPTVNTTTTYYAQAVEISSSESGLGALLTPVPANSLLSAERGIVFTTVKTFSLVSAQFYTSATSGTGSITARLVDDSNGSEVYSKVIPITITGAGWYTLPLDFAVQSGKTYRLLGSASSISYNNLDTGVNYAVNPFKNLGTFGTIIGGYDSGLTTSSYSLFHNITAQERCAGARVPVVATLTTPPAFTLSTGAVTTCPSQPNTTPVTIATGAGQFDTFVWSPNPGTVTGNSTSGWQFAPAATTTYTLTASQSGGSQCSTTAQVVVTVNNVAVSAVATPSLSCQGTPVVLSAQGPQSLPGTYCTADSSSGAGIDPIASVNFNTLSDNSVQTSPWSTDYPASGNTTTTVTAGQTYSLAVTNSGANTIASVWIDFNRNGVLEASEHTQLWTSATSGPVNITIPVNAAAGWTAMRIRTRTSGNPNGSGDACTAFGSGTTRTYTINIAAPTSYSYSWAVSTAPGTPIGTGQTLNVSPSATTTYIVTATDSTTGCSNTASTTVTVQTDPIGPITGGANSICLGAPGTIDFDNSAVGTNWTSSNPAVATIDVNGILTVLSAGTTVIGANVFNGTTGCTTYATNPQTVNVYAPVVITGQPASSSILPGDNTSFSVSTTGNVVSYQWQVSTNNISFTNLAESATFSGTTTPTLTVTNAQLANNGTYYQCVIVANAPCSSPVTSESALLTVATLAVTNPDSVALCSTGTGDATFTVTANGTVDQIIWEIFDGNQWIIIDDVNQVVGNVTFTGDISSGTLEVHGLTTANNNWAVRANALHDEDVATSAPATITVSVPASITSNPGNGSACFSGATTHFLASATGATAIQWQFSTTGSAPWTDVANGTPVGASYAVTGNASSSDLSVITTGAISPTGTYYYRAVAVSPNGCPNANSTPAILAIKTPEIVVTPSSTFYCNPSSAVSMTASGANTYTWSPTTGLFTDAAGTIPYTGGNAVTVYAKPNVTVTYTVTGTDATGCANTTQQTISSQGAVAVDVTATPQTVCPNDPVQLNALATASTNTAVNLYSFATGTGASLASMTGATTVIGTSNDDDPVAGIALPFTFNYAGSTYTHYSPSPDGWIRLQNNTSTAGSQFSNSMTSSTNIPKIAPYWDDMATGTDGYVKAITMGTAPNRIVVLEWFVTIPRNTTGAANSTFQLWLYENNKIEMRYGTMGSGSMSATVGLRGAASDYNSVTVSSNTASTTSANDSNSGQPASGRFYRFVPGNQPTFSYAWTSVPAGFTSSVANPIVNPAVNTTYNVTVTASSGCSATGSTSVTVQSGALITTQPSDVTACQGTTVTLSVAATGAGLTYQWYKGVIGSGTIVPSATSANFTTTNAAPALSGTYYVIVTPTCGAPVTSSQVTVLVNPTPTATAPATQNFCAGITTTPIALVGTPSGVTFDISGGASVGLANQTNVTSIPAFTTVLGSATVTVTPKANGCTGTAVTFTINVNAVPDDLTVTPSTATICANGAPVLLTAGGGLIAPSAYCTPTIPNTTSPGATGDYIKNFSFANITNNNTDDAPSDYTYYNALTANVTGGSSYTVTVEAGGTTSLYAQQFRVWIDYNRNGVFEASESVFNTTTSSLSGSPQSGTVVIPTTAYNGITRMRVLSNYSSTPLNTASCQNGTGSSYGEYEDYNVNITGATPQVPMAVWTTGGPGVYTGLFTNAGGTTNYTGTPSNTVYARPTVSATVTATVSGPAPTNCSKTATSVFTVNPVPTVVAPSTQTVCTNTLTSPIAVSGTPSGFTFDISGGSSIGLSDQTNATSIPAFTATGTSAVITLTPKANGCTGTPVTFTINVSPATVGGSVSGASAAACPGSTSGLLTLSGHTGTVVRWESSVAPFSTWTPIVNTSTTYTSGPLTQTTQFRAVVKSGACIEAVSTPVTISINSVTLSSISSPQVCVNAQATITMNGLEPNSTSTVTFTRGGVTQPTVVVIADASGVGSFPVMVTAASQVITVTSIQRTDSTPSCTFNPTSGNSITLVTSTGCTNTIVCGWTLSAIDEQVIANIVSNATAYRWRITRLDGSLAPTTEVQTLDTPLRVMKFVQLAQYRFATTYRVEVATLRSGVWGPYGPACNVSTPVVTTNLTACPQQALTNLADIIYANNVPYATGYRFRITDPLNGANTQTIDRAVREVRMNLVTAFQVQYNKVYNVEVAVKNTDGTFMPFNTTVCTVKTPAFPTTSVQDTQCEDYAVPTYTTPIYAISYPGAVQYVFQLKGLNAPYNGPNGVEVTKFTRVFTLADFPGLIPGATYDVRVRLVFNTADPAGPFGKVCTIVAPGASRVVKQPFNAVAYPNPFAENFNIEVTTSALDNVTVKVYDMAGRILETHNVHVNEMATLKVGDRFPAGVYNVIVSQGEEVKTLRVVKR